MSLFDRKNDSSINFVPKVKVDKNTSLPADSNNNFLIDNNFLTNSNNVNREISGNNKKDSNNNAFFSNSKNNIFKDPSSSNNNIALAMPTAITTNLKEKESLYNLKKSEDPEENKRKIQEMLDDEFTI